MRARAVVGLLLMAAACSAPAPAPAGGTAFLCRVEGAPKAPLTPDALCGAMRATLGPELPGGARAVDALPADARDWVRVDLRVGKGGVLSGRITRARAGAVDSLPELSIAMSDRALGPDTAAQLAAQLAAQIR